MEPVIIIELVLTAVATIVSAAILGYLGQKLMGAAILGGGAAIASVISRLREQSEALTSELSRQLADPSPENLDAARENVRKMQFLAKLRHDAENLEAELDDEAY